MFSLGFFENLWGTQIRISDLRGHSLALSGYDIFLVKQSTLLWLVFQKIIWINSKWLLFKQLTLPSLKHIKYIEQLRNKVEIAIHFNLQFISTYSSFQLTIHFNLQFISTYNSFQLTIQKIIVVSKKWPAVTRIRTWVASATTKSTNHYTITAIRSHDINRKES